MPKIEKLIKVLKHKRKLAACIRHESKVLEFIQSLNSLLGIFRFEYLGNNGNDKEYENNPAGDFS